MTNSEKKIESVVATIDILTNAFKIAWSEDTSSNENWSSENSASGQCVVTACILQDYLSGEILHTTATLLDGTTISHYFNRLNGADIDLTKQQFPAGAVFSEAKQKTKGFDSTREYCLSFPETYKRYELLKSRVTKLTKDNAY